MIRRVELPTQLVDVLPLYREEFDMTRAEYESEIRDALVRNDSIILVDKSAERIFGFIVARMAKRRNRPCADVVVAYSRFDNRGTWGWLVKAVMKWAGEKGVQDVFISRNLRWRRK